MIRAQAVVWLAYLLCHASGQPWADDQSVFLDGNGLFQPHNEHLIVLSRALGCMTHNITALVVVGNCMLFATIAVLARSGLDARLVALLFLNPMHHENMLWATAAVQNYGVLLFGCAAICYDSLVLGVAAALTSANGVAALLIVLWRRVRA